jgi:hypothetical protein
VQDRWVRERYEHEHPGWQRGRQRGWDRNERDGDDQERNYENRGHGKKSRGKERD